MMARKPRPALSPRAAVAKTEREARLATALRRNLGKRKAQSREPLRAAAAPDAPPERQA